MRKLAIATLAALIVATPAGATATGGAGYETTTEREENEFPWGLLGLLGLAGLLGRKRNDRDVRRDTTTGGTANR